MQNCNSKFKIFSALDRFVLLYEKEIAKEFTQIYTSRKSPNSAGDFRFKRTGKENSRSLSKDF